MVENDRAAANDAPRENAVHTEGQRRAQDEVQQARESGTINCGAESYRQIQASSADLQNNDTFPNVSIDGAGQGHNANASQPERSFQHSTDSSGHGGNDGLQSDRSPHRSPVETDGQSSPTNGLENGQLSANIESKRNAGADSETQSMLSGFEIHDNGQSLSGSSTTDPVKAENGAADKPTQEQQQEQGGLEKPKCKMEESSESFAKSMFDLQQTNQWQNADTAGRTQMLQDVSTNHLFSLGLPPATISSSGNMDHEGHILIKMLQ